MWRFLSPGGEPSHHKFFKTLQICLEVESKQGLQCGHGADLKPHEMHIMLLSSILQA